MRRSPQGVMSLSYYDGGSGRGLLSCYAKAKPRPSKWDDAQRWLSSSRAPDDDRRRSSCADDRTLLPLASEMGRATGGRGDGDQAGGRRACVRAAAVPLAARRRHGDDARREQGAVQGQHPSRHSAGAGGPP
jgi:hypothetical protein